MRAAEIIGKTYQVVYRIADQDTTSGTPEERYNDITGRLKKMEAATREDEFEDAGHVATSTWLVKSNKARAADLLAELRGRLTANKDLLLVAEVVKGNRAQI
ncbi:hypothetical protein CAF53_02410 [Sphingobium sp. LB126]|uniref:hypothetical protein n=1 Tax=Sphingobium sp. LB126 TaxID=1983755 RepID=UPI000C20B799|nr:hypothetical protein [Sphingobium sp. LB126]PJG47220.1 hypothetical protein CAF53_02410 [Sphingobium sp. LB126]